MGSRTTLIYHVVLTTKYRRKVLLGIEQETYRAFREIEAHSSFKILDMGIEDGNHIHLVIKSSPQYSVSGIVNRLKGWSLYHLWNNSSEHLSSFYRGEKKKLWHGGYDCNTVGKVSQDKILEYVKSQNGESEK